MPITPFTHKMNRTHKPLSAPEVWKNHPVILIEDCGEHSKIRVNNNDFYVPSEYLTPIEGVGA